MLDSIQPTAFRLAFETDEGLRTSEYGYFNAEAAETAVPTLNLVRFVRGRQRYTHLVRFDGKQPVEVRALDELAAYG